MFQGFSQGTIDFLWGIRFHNEKAWFESHREEYLSALYKPMRELAQDVYDALTGSCPDLDLRCHVSRIHRDARRLHGKGPYKDHLWFSLRRETEDWTDTPVFWFELTPESYGFGLGCYNARPVTMARHRARIDRNPQALTRLAEAFNRQSVFQLDGEDYKQPKGNPGALLAPWYNKKTISFSCDRLHDDLLFSPALVRTVTDGYLSLMPLYRYFITLDGDPDPRL